MGKHTNIQWCHSACNPIMGCDGCELWNPAKGVKRCYAGILTERYGGHNKGFPAKFEDVTEYPGRMASAAKWGPPTEEEQREKPWLPTDRRVIFISDMGDALSRIVSFEYLKREIIDVVRDTPHIWMWLTKRANRLEDFDFWLHSKGEPWPSNLWGGTTVDNQASVRRIAHLAGTRIPMLFVSGEPQSERVEIVDVPGAGRISLWIQGGASGDDAELFHPEWATLWKEWCAEHGRAYFLKQLGANVAHMKLKHSHGGDWSEWPNHLRVRQWPEEKPLP